MVPQFDEILNECRELHKRKSADYANDEDPFLNFRITGLTGISARLVDKSVRLFNIWQKGERKVSDETIEDTMKDIIVLGALALSWYRTQEKNPMPASSLDPKNFEDR